MNIAGREEVGANPCRTEIATGVATCEQKGMFRVESELEVRVGKKGLCVRRQRREVVQRAKRWASKESGVYLDPTTVDVDNGCSVVDPM